MIFVSSGRTAPPARHYPGFLRPNAYGLSGYPLLRSRADLYTLLRSLGMPPLLTHKTFAYQFDEW